MTQKELNELKMNKLRTELSIKRTLMSFKRSLLSYISTACVFVSLAFTYLKLAVPSGIDFYAIAMFCVGVAFLVFGLIEYVINKREAKHILEKFENELGQEEQELTND